MKVLILADGEGKRWGNYQGVPKQLLRIDGETLIDRMCRQLHENGADDIVIIGPYKNRYASNDKFSSDIKRKLFQDIAERYREPFILLNGDCYYTDEIIRDCLGRVPEDGWLHWCCPHRNEYTGKPYGEGYIHKVTDWQWWIRELKEFNYLADAGLIRIRNDWSINRYLYGWDDLTTHYRDPSHLSKYDVYWQDETDDFDYPDDYDRFMKCTHRRE